MRRRQDHLELIAQSPPLDRLARAASEPGELQAIGSAGSSTALVAGALARRTGRPVLLVVAHLDDADEAVDELTAVSISAQRLAALEMVPGESNVNLELFAERLSLIRALVGGVMPQVLVAPIHALMQAAPAPDNLDRLSLQLHTGREFPVDKLVRWLDEAGYMRVDSIEEPGDFAVRGGILDIFPPGATSGRDDDRTADSVPIRLDFFGDEIESINEIDLDTMGSDRRMQAVDLIGARIDLVTDDNATINVLELIPEKTIAVVSETIEVTEQGRGYYERVINAGGIFGPPAVFKALRRRFPVFAEINQFGSTAATAHSSVINLPVRPLVDFSRDAGEAVGELGELASSHDVLVLCQNDGEQQRLSELLVEFAPDAPVRHAVCYLHRGFIWGDDDPKPESRPLAVIPYHELLHRYQTRRRIRRLRGGKATEAFMELQVGDYVVHTDHGIARFVGLRTLKPRKVRRSAQERAEEKLRAAAGEKTDAEGRGEEYLTLEFSGRAKLHVPVTQIDKVQKYVGGNASPALSALGGRKWKNQKEQVKEAVRDLAAELLRVQAVREHTPGVRYPADSAWQKEFEAEFPYEETEDQLAALIEIKKDMSGAQPMDRLLCGDVGYGKTEVAIRAAFKAAEFGKQVAILVPTTLLAEQHERTFRQRFADYPFRVESISRFKTRAEQNKVLAEVRKGQIDVLIGTHRLISKDVRFADLGLVIIDEEQRFGVEHKQALLKLRMTADILTLSATPIPRTLHMAMLGLRDISSLTTPPLDRRAVVTEVIPYNEKRIQQAIARELSRDGQVYFVHNRVHNIKSVADDLQKLAPDARIVIGHGQMPDGELESVMRTFINREADILVSTTIIESGIDIPTANTMFINDADMFGLADLHQLRGRVGRYKHRAYCYLLLPKNRTLSEVAVKRLKAIEQFSMLGAGFKIAMRDLEIRGAGNLLGAEQSGHIAAVGYDMYCRLLDEAARELRNESLHEPSATIVEIGISGSLPKPYIPSDTRRLEAYRRIASARTRSELVAVERDLTQAYGQPPLATQELLDLAELRILAAAVDVRSIRRHERDVIFLCERPEELLSRLQAATGTVRPLPAKSDPRMIEVYFRPPENYLEPTTLLTVLRARLRAEAPAPAATADS